MIATTTYQQQLRRRKKYDQDKDTVVNETGETQALLGRLDDICQNEVEICHSPFENAPWDVNKDFQTVDIFEIVVMAVFLLPQLLLLYPILFVLLLPPVASNLLYMYILVPSISDTIPSSTTSWKVHCIVQAILCIPSAVVALMSLAISRLAMVLFGTLYCMHTEGGWQRYNQNLNIIKPYCNGPPLYQYFSDCVIAVAGMVYRRGLIEFTSSFTLMFIFNPWIKYWITGNIWTSDLKERFVTQFGSRLDDMTTEQIASSFRNYISRSKNSSENRQYISNPVLFCPHFPYPGGRKRKWAVAIEHSTIACFVHTRHFQSKLTNNECNGLESATIKKKEPGCLSRSADVPIYRVILWRNNPYHIYTGVVEASISKMQQALEHPMWLVSGHNKLAADPKVLLSTGWIDVFFDEFIPHLDFFIRNEHGHSSSLDSDE